MRMVFGLVLLVGIALAGGAVYLAKDRIAQYQNANAQAQAALAQIVPTKNVFVASEGLRYGQRLTREDVRVVAWPENAIPEGSFLDEELLFPSNTDELRVVLRAIEKDEAIMAIKITEPW
jgi:pilus assembly protein CpaB